jgi:AsmA family/AsmA-like C-terminal region
VQTALLSAGIAIILALVTALVGPLFVDWGSYRGELETRVASLTGLEVRVTGPIDVRLLPTPTLTLRQIELGRPGDAAKTRAQALEVEFSLSDLLRGEWRAPDLKLQAPELTLGLDAQGRLAWSAPTIGLDPDAVSIDHIEVVHGRATFTDAASGGRLVLEDLAFTGQVRSLLGPVKGEGSFVVAGQHYPFRLSVARPVEDGGVKVRLNLDAADNQRSVDVDGAVFVERGLPRFEGAMQVARPVASGQQGAAEPWRMSARLNGNGKAVVLQQIELQYGAEERAIRLKGDAKLTFGAAPELEAALSAPQLDLDRVLDLPEAEGRRPLIAIRRLVESFVGAQHLPVPVRLGISVDTVTLAGAMLQRLGGDLQSVGEGWDIERLSFRAPGLSQLAFSGRLDATSGGVAFQGLAKIDSADPRALAGWLADRGNGSATPLGPLHLSSDIVLAGGKIAFDRLQVELDRMKVEGHLDYVWPNGDQPAKLNAALHAGELDLDRVQSLLLASIGDIQWPREGTLAVDVARAAWGGVEATDVAIKMRRDAGTLDVERVAIGDIGGTKLTVTGRIDTHDAAPRGAVALDIDARSLDGLVTLIEKLSPASADRIRRTAGRAVPLKLHSSFALDRGAAASTVAKLRLQGTAGTFRLDLQGDADGADMASLDPARLGGAKVHLNTVVDAGDGSALVDMLGLDRLVGVSQRSGRLVIDANGSFAGDMTAKAELVAGGLDVSANGTVHPWGDAGPTAQMALRASAADVVPLRAMARRNAQAPWSTLTARLGFADSTATLADLNGTLAGVGIKGELGIGVTGPLRMTGDLAVASLDLPATIGAMVGFPRASTNDSAWSADPFEAGALGAASGHIAIKAAQVALNSRLSARDVRAVLDLHQSELAVTDIDGGLARGRISGDFGFGRSDDETSAHSHFKLADVDAAELLGGGGRSPLAGKLSAELGLEGAGRSPIALVGSLKGEGKLTLRDGSVARFDPAAFDVVTRAVDQGLPIDAARVGERMEAALAAGALPVELAEGSLNASLGQLRLGDLKVETKSTEFACAGSVDLTQGVIDARLMMSAPKAADSAGRPDISVSLTGPLDMPRRTLQVTALTNWLARRSVDQKTKRVDALEQAAREHPLEGEVAPESTERDSTATVSPPAATPLPRFVRPNLANPLTSSVPPTGTTRQRPAQDAPAPSGAGDGSRSNDDARARRPTTEQVPPSAVPLDIRPQVGPRAPRADNTTRDNSQRLDNAPRLDNPPRTDTGSHPLQPLRFFQGLFGQ